jgi:predicted nucleic acid-binding protein
VAGLVLDAGPLVAADKRSDVLRAWLSEARRRAEPPIVSAVTVAEVWRGGRLSARLGQLLKRLDVVNVDEDLARQAGELLAATGQDDPADAIVVALASQRGCAVLTADTADIEPLAGAANVRVVPFTP